MEAKNIYGLALLAGLFGLALWLHSRTPEPKPGDVVENVGANDAFYAPFYQTNPGIWDNVGILNGSNVPFESTVKLEVSAPSLNSLSNQYMPMFGYVGVVGA